MKKRLFVGAAVALVLTQFQLAAAAPCKAQVVSPNTAQTTVYDLPRRFQLGQM